MLNRSQVSKLLPLLALGVALGLAPLGAAAQIVSGVGNVNLNANLAETLTVTVTSGSTVNFTLVPAGVAAGDVPAVIQTSWVLHPSRGAAALFGYFDVAASALTDGLGNDIPSANVQGRVTTGTPVAFTAITQTNALGPAGAGLELFSEVITGVNKNKTRNDNLDLQIDLSSLPQLPAGAYTGILRIQARAF